MIDPDEIMRSYMDEWVRTCDREERFVRERLRDVYDRPLGPAQLIEWRVRDGSWHLGLVYPGSEPAESALRSVEPGQVARAGETEIRTVTR